MIAYQSCLQTAIVRSRFRTWSTIISSEICLSPCPLLSLLLFLTLLNLVLALHKSARTAVLLYPRQKSREKCSVGLLILVPGLVRKSSIRWKVASRAWRGREREAERGALTAIWAPPPPDPTCGRPRDR